jgi:small membrane protein
MIILFQLLFSFFVCLIVGNIAGSVRSGDISLRGGALWVLVWAMALLLVLFPHVASYIANIFGIGRGSDVVLYAAVALLFGISFSLHVKLSRIEQSLTRVVREDALTRVNK